MFDRAMAERSWIGAPTVRALDAGGGFATWAVATDDIERDVASLSAAGAGLTEPIEGERARPDGSMVRWRLSVPRELGPDRPPFLIEHDTSAAEWTPADRAARAFEVHPLGGPVRLSTLELPITDMPGTIAGLMRTVRIGPFRPSLAGRGARDAVVGQPNASTPAAAADRDMAGPKVAPGGRRVRRAARRRRPGLPDRSPEDRRDQDCWQERSRLMPRNAMRLVIVVAVMAFGGLRLRTPGTARRADLGRSTVVNRVPCSPHSSWRRTGRSWGQRWGPRPRTSCHPAPLGRSPSPSPRVRDGRSS